MDILLDKAINLEEIAYLCQVGIKRKLLTGRDGNKWHVTSLLHAGRNIARGDVSYSDGVAQVTGIMSLGTIWQTVVDCYLTHYAVNLGGFYTPDVESVKDDILGSLDGIMWLPDMGWMVCETKLRFTLNSEIPLSHLQQVRAYCHLAETDLVCYVSGHITSRPPEAQARMRIFRLTDRSIQECWQGLITTKEFLIGKGCCPEGVVSK